MLRLGGGVISTENAREFSSASKGENIEDTMRIVESYADVIAVRYHEWAVPIVQPQSPACRSSMQAMAPANILPRRSSIGSRLRASSAQWMDYVSRWLATSHMDARHVHSPCCSHSHQDVSLVFVAPAVTPMGEM